MDSPNPPVREPKREIVIDETPVKRVRRTRFSIFSPIRLGLPRQQYPNSPFREVPNPALPPNLWDIPIALTPSPRTLHRMRVLPETPPPNSKKRKQSMQSRAFPLLEDPDDVVGAALGLPSSSKPSAMGSKDAKENGSESKNSSGGSGSKEPSP